MSCRGFLKSLKHSKSTISVCMPHRSPGPLHSSCRFTGGSCLDVPRRRAKWPHARRLPWLLSWSVLCVHVWSWSSGLPNLAHLSQVCQRCSRRRPPWSLSRPFCDHNPVLEPPGAQGTWWFKSEGCRELGGHRELGFRSMQSKSQSLRT